MQYAFTRNPAALATAIEKGISLSKDDLTLAIEHLYLHPERLGPAGTFAERIIAQPEFRQEHITPLIFSLGASPVEQKRLHFLFSRTLTHPSLQESQLIALTTALCSARLEVRQKIDLFSRIATHPKRSALVLMGRFFTYELSADRNWIGLGVIEAIHFLPSDHDLASDIIREIAGSPTSNIQCQRSLTHTLEILPLPEKDRITHLTRVLHWPNLCQHVRSRILHLLNSRDELRST